MNIPQKGNEYTFNCDVGSIENSTDTNQATVCNNYSMKLKAWYFSKLLKCMRSSQK